MQFVVKYLFPTLFSGENFYIYGLLEGRENEENIEKMQIKKTRKRTTNQGGYFSDFHGFSWSCASPRKFKFHQWRR